MVLLLKILISLVGLICFAGGANLLLKGAKAFLPADLPAQPVLDDLIRFLSGIYFGMGFLMAYLVFNLDEQFNIFYFVGLVVIFSGLGRLYSRIKVGSAGRYFDIIMWVEVALGAAIIAAEAFRFPAALS